MQVESHPTFFFLRLPGTVAHLGGVMMTMLRPRRFENWRTGRDQAIVLKTVTYSTT